MLPRDNDQQSLPKPLPISVQGAINTAAHILSSFPVPQLAVPTPLPCWSSLAAGSSTGEEAATAGPSPSWTAPQLKALSREMQESVAILVQSGKFTRFLQDELHRETVPFGAPSESYPPAGMVSAVPASAAPSSQSSSCPAGDAAENAGPATFSAAAAAEQVGREVSGTLTSILSSMAQKTATTLDHPSSLSRAKPEAWAPAPRETGGMTLRPRTVPLAPLRSAPEDAPERSRGRKTKRSASPLPPHPLGYPSVKATDIIDASLRDAVREVIEHTETVVNDMTALQQFNALLSLHTEPFKGVTAEQISRFLSLMGAAEDGCSPGATTPALASTPATGRRRKGKADEWPIAVRALCCLSTVTHSAFDPHATPTELLSWLIGVCYSVVRRVGHALARPASELAEMREEIAKAAKLSRARPLGNSMPSVIASGNADTPTPLMWIELLRLYLLRFGVAVCSRDVCLVADADLERLEDIVFQCLFIAPHRASTKEVFYTYASYVLDAALHTYRCVWDRLEVQRNITAENFFPRLPLSEFLSLRTHTVTGGKKLMPFTVAVLTAAQSVPAAADLQAGAQARRLLGQCNSWAGCLVEQFMLPHFSKKGDRTTQDIMWQVVTQLLEDLCDLLGMPEWPAADLLLRSCVLALAQIGLGAGGGGVLQDGPCTPPPPSSSTVDSPLLTAHVVDALAHVAYKLLDHASATPAGSEALEVLLAEVPVDTAIQQDWAAALNAEGSTGALDQPRTAAQRYRRGGRSESPSRKRERTTGDGEDASLSQAGGRPDAVDQHDAPQSSPSLPAPVSSIHRTECLVFYALSRHSELNAAADVSSSWLHTRAAHVLTWHLYPTDPLPEGAADRLLSKTAVPCAGIETSWEQLRCWCRTLASAQKSSMLSATMQRVLVSLLLSVFHVRDAQGNEAVASDMVLKKALGHLSRLSDLYPPLLRQVSPIARRCARDESARIREASVPILLTLLGGVAGKRARPSDGVYATASHASSATADDERLAAEIITTLVLLLDDKSVTVVTRTIAALDSLLVDRQYHWLFGTEAGGTMLSYVQYKLLSLVGPLVDSKHSADVTRHFLRRWVITLLDEEASPAGAHAQLARELATLTVLVTPTFPYEISADHPLILLLRGMRQSVDGAHGDHQTRAVAAASSTSVHGLIAVGASASGDATTGVKRRARNTVDGQQLRDAMCSAASALWSMHRSSVTAENAVRYLATLHVLSEACAEWVKSPLSSLCCLEYPVSTRPCRLEDTARQADCVAGILLQSCHILRAVMSTWELPTISLPCVAQQLTRLLSKYMGPYQQRIIVASIAALTSMITCAKKHGSVRKVNQTYLTLCYSLMNTYYVALSSMVQDLGSHPQKLPYAQRYLFLLSEFLRLYPDWVHPKAIAILQQDTLSSSVGTSSNTPNELVKGPGICDNVFSLVEAVLQQCTAADARKKVFSISLRVLASLCMLSPTVYLRSCEPHLSEALCSSEVATRVQGLSFIRDFLVEEDARVDSAACLADRQLGGARASAARGAKRRRGSAESDNSSSETERTSGGSSGSCEGSHPARSLEGSDNNSGMSPWLVQAFHVDIGRLSLTQSVAVRSLCLEVLQIVAQEGLLPPAKYLDLVVTLTTDADASIRKKATLLLHAHTDRYEEVMAAQTSRVVQLAYQLRCACGENFIDSAYTSAEGNGLYRSERSVFSVFFASLHKRHRDNFIVTLSRYFYQEAKAAAWYRTFADGPVSAASSSALHKISASTFLGFLAVGVTLCPFSSTNDVLGVLQHCRTGIDLNGQSALDFLTEWCDDESKGSSRGRDGLSAAVDRLALWKAVGTVLLAYMRRALRVAYRLTSSKLHKIFSGPGSAHATPVHDLEPRNAAIVSFLASVRALAAKTDAFQPLCSPSSDATPSIPCSTRGEPPVGAPSTLPSRAQPALTESEWRAAKAAAMFLKQELEAALEERDADDITRKPLKGSHSIASKSTARQKDSIQRLPNKRVRKPTVGRGRPCARRRRGISSSSSSVSSGSVSESSDASEEEEEAEGASESLPSFSSEDANDKDPSLSTETASDAES